MLKRKWFTLIEVLLVTMIASSIIIIVYSLLDTLPKVKNFNDARQTLIQQVNDAMDRFTVIFQDYTIDYEEYYNRRALGCSTGWWVGDDFKWNVGLSWYCSIPTYYWNAHGTSEAHSLSYWEEKDRDNVKYEPPYSYWEYKRSFWNFWRDTDWSHIGQKPARVWDADDRDEGVWDIAVWDPENVQELYLISHDKTKRIFLRRKFNPYTPAQASTLWSSWWYTIQILKLRWFDAWNNHDFKWNPSSDVWIYDWQIDTWACDAWQYFVCWLRLPSQEDDPYNIHYPGKVPYFRPVDLNDWWVNLFDDKLNILNWNIELYPVKDQELAWKEVNQHINPYFKITITAWLSEHLFSNRSWWGTWWFTYSLENIYDTKGFYIQ